ncbi:MAG: glutaredoxin family protein [Halieaceae bacterium]|jgi:glutaredoxin|nr:glutaredoxin family protein [Halieaceae bacterium]
MREVTLYTTAGCHLCEMAEEVLHDCGVQFTPVDIADRPELIERYGVRIPVIALPSGRELGWPFDGSAVTAFLAVDI